MTCRQVITIYQRLGGGKTGSVFLCQHPDFPDPIAIKFCPIDPNDPTDALYYAKREYELLLLCRDNPHVTGTMGFSEKGEDYEFITAEGGEWSFNNGENDGALRGVPFLLIDTTREAPLSRRSIQPCNVPAKLLPTTKLVGKTENVNIVNVNAVNTRRLESLETYAGSGMIL